MTRPRTRRWTTFLEAFGKLFNAHIVELEMIGPAESIRVTEWIGMSEGARRDFNDYYAHINPWLSTYDNAVAGDAEPSHVVLPDSTYRKTEYFNDFGRRIGQYYGMAGVIFKSPAEIGILGVLRDKEAGPCTEEDAQCLRILLPHLARSLRIGTQMSHLEGQAGLMLDWIGWRAGW
jgi:hypothetical protein